MIKLGINTRTANNVKIILEKIKQLDKKIEFDNQCPNAYALIINGKRYEFNVYKDVINALDLMIIMKEGK